MPSGSKVMGRMAQRLAELSEDFAAHLDRFERRAVFTGPSGYFHRKTLARRSLHADVQALLADDLFFDFLYATLAAWGLHRMGPGKTKLRDIEELKESFRAQAGVLEQLRDMTITALDARGAERVARTLWPVLARLRVSEAEFRVVANTKALHHVLPSLLPPIDRTYTLTFFYGRKNLTVPEPEAFLEIYAAFHRIASDNASLIGARSGVGQWNTSETKIIDNAIVGYMLGIGEAEPFGDG